MTCDHYCNEVWFKIVSVVIIVLTHEFYTAYNICTLLDVVLFTDQCFLSGLPQRPSRGIVRSKMQFKWSTI